MALKTRSASLDEVVREVVDPVVQRLSKLIAEHVANMVANQLANELDRRPGRATRPASRAGRRAEMTKWVADKRARRVPNFVIETTGLDTKKKIVAKFGDGAAFEKGKPLPPEAKPVEPRVVKAKRPTIRKKAAAA